MEKIKLETVEELVQHARKIKKIMDQVYICGYYAIVKFFNSGGMGEGVRSQSHYRQLITEHARSEPVIVGEVPTMRPLLLRN